MHPKSTENQKYLTSLAQLASILVIGSLFFGFLIVNLYLASFGFWDFNFLRVQYLSAGILFLFCVTLSVILAYAFFRSREILKKNKLRNPNFFKTAIVFIANVLIFGLLISLNIGLFIILLSLGGAVMNASFLNFISTAWVSVVWIVVSTIISAQREIREVGTKEITLQNTVLYFGAHSKLFSVLIALPILLLIFSFAAYPVIPRYFGGGKPTIVNIGLRQSFDPTQIEAANPLNALLVHQSSDSVLVVIDSGTFLLQQDDISYIKYLERNRSLDIGTSFNNSSGATSTYGL